MVGILSEWASSKFDLTAELPDPTCCDLDDAYKPLQCTTKMYLILKKTLNHSIVQYDIVKVSFSL